MTTFLPQLLLAAVGLASEPVRVAPEPADVQFFGDVYLPERALRMTSSDSARPALFDNVRPLLSTARHNVVNLEGAITDAFVPHEPKRHLLRMPRDVPKVLRAAGITAATLANNHAFDYGAIGLFDTTTSLKQAGIAVSGAGDDRTTALAPLILHTPRRSVCVIPLSRTLPRSFWATDSSPGTAFADADETDRLIAACVARGHFTIVSYHWGQELQTSPQSYQRTLARRAIDAGAGAVMGHHPHVLQSVEIYKGRLIVYSLGNFIFGTFPVHSNPQGMAARLAFDDTTLATLRWDLIPLDVDNTRTGLKTRPLDPTLARAAFDGSSLDACTWRQADAAYSCRLPIQSELPWHASSALYLSRSTGYFSPM